jgi:hypothetical protein
VTADSRGKAFDGMGTTLDGAGNGRLVQDCSWVRFGRVASVTGSLEAGGARVWRCADLGGVELFRASGIQFTFRPHAHEQFYGLFGALAAVVSAIVALGAAAAWWSAKGASFDWGQTAMWTTIAGGIAWSTAFAAMGVGLGALIRNLTGAIAVALAWIALIEGIVGQLIGNLARWLPFYAGQALGAGGKSMLPQALLPRWGAALVLAAYTAAFAVAAITTSVRRDVC